MENKRRLATLVGCNYASTRNELRGCINDVKAMRDLLVHRLGFNAKDIVILTDEVGAEVLPTGANIRQALRRMIDQAESGDILLFHYSGHGTLIPPAKQQHGRPRHRDEAIVPSDFNLITDVDFRELVDRLPDRATFTMISDSCHSGGLIQNEKEQIGPSTSLESSSTNLLHQRPKFIPFSSILRHLSSISGLSSPHIADHLSTLFGSDASPKFVPPTTTLHHPYMDHDEVHNDGGILLSGCQANETSADVSPDEVEGTEGKAYGAFSNALQMVMRGEERKMSYREVVMKARELLRQQGFEQQHPCLYCSDENADKMFLMMDEVKEIGA
ncbi:metacaspase-9 [Phalaenopsis equestris]|uniref:metacaspase-9 n=1 Tax=Phalaenopsis equestris TaxID=78828 RepID=UPI0009E19D84|nr:metacaspase-9 [Phalaenopsis equestris]